MDTRNVYDDDTRDVDEMWFNCYPHSEIDLYKKKKKFIYNKILYIKNNMSGITHSSESKMTTTEGKTASATGNHTSWSRVIVPNDTKYTDEQLINWPKKTLGELTLEERRVRQRVLYRGYSREWQRARREKIAKDLAEIAEFKRNEALEIKEAMIKSKEDRLKKKSAYVPENEEEKKEVPSYLRKKEAESKDKEPIDDLIKNEENIEVLRSLARTLLLQQTAAKGQLLTQKKKRKASEE